MLIIVHILIEYDHSIEQFHDQVKILTDNLNQ